MSEVQEDQTPWYKSAAKVTIATLGVVEGIWILIGLFSESFRNWLTRHGLIGWLLLAATVFVGLIVIHNLDQRRATERRRAEKELELQHDRIKKELEDENKLRDRQCAADVGVIEKQLGSFMTQGENRTELGPLYDSRYFSHKLSTAFEQLEDTFQDNSKVVFDTELSSLLDETKAAFFTYWKTIEDKLDAPPEIYKNHWDLQIIKPPGGGWGYEPGKSNDGSLVRKPGIEPIDDYYTFIRSLHPLLSDFLDNVDAVEAQLHRLRIEAGLEPKI